MKKIFIILALLLLSSFCFAESKYYAEIKNFLNKGNFVCITDEDDVQVFILKDAIAYILISEDKQINIVAKEYFIETTDTIKIDIIDVLCDEDYNLLISCKYL